MASRKDILDMLARGEIDVDRATELLSQAHSAPAPDVPPPPRASMSSLSGAQPVPGLLRDDDHPAAALPQL